MWCSFVLALGVFSSYYAMKLLSSFLILTGVLNVR